MTNEKSRLVDIKLEQQSFPVPSADVEHERSVAIFDILEANEFRCVGRPSGNQVLTLSVMDQKLVFDVTFKNSQDRATHILSLTPFRKVFSDYRLICDSYYDAISSASTERVESIDMARRGVHNEGAELLRDRLAGKIEVDFDTSRRLFTLISGLGAVS